MEFMLMRDGSVRAFNHLAMHSDVTDALADYGGIAYYWHTETFGWSCIAPGDPAVGDKRILIESVPVVIKLAAMLE